MATKKKQQATSTSKISEPIANITPVVYKPLHSIPVQSLRSLPPTDFKPNSQSVCTNADMSKSNTILERMLLSRSKSYVRSNSPSNPKPIPLKNKANEKLQMLKMKREKILQKIKNNGNDTFHQELLRFVEYKIKYSKVLLCESSKKIRSIRKPLTTVNSEKGIKVKTLETNHNSTLQNYDPQKLNPTLSSECNKNHSLLHSHIQSNDINTKTVTQLCNQNTITVQADSMLQNISDSGENGIQGNQNMNISKVCCVELNQDINISNEREIKPFQKTSLVGDIVMKNVSKNDRECVANDNVLNNKPDTLKCTQSTKQTSNTIRARMEKNKNKTLSKNSELNVLPIKATTKFLEHFITQYELIQKSSNSNHSEYLGDVLVYLYNRIAVMKDKLASMKKERERLSPTMKNTVNLIEDKNASIKFQHITASEREHFYLYFQSTAMQSSNKLKNPHISYIISTLLNPPSPFDATFKTPPSDNTANFKLCDNICPNIGKQIPPYTSDSYQKDTPYWNYRPDDPSMLRNYMSDDVSVSNMCMPENLSVFNNCLPEDPSMHNQYMPNDPSMLHVADNPCSMIATSKSSHSIHSSAISEWKQVHCNSNADGDTGGVSYPGEINYSNAQIQFNSLVNQKRPTLLEFNNVWLNNQKRRQIKKTKKAIHPAIDNEKNANTSCNKAQRYLATSTPKRTFSNIEPIPTNTPNDNRLSSSKNKLTSNNKKQIPNDTKLISSATKRIPNANKLVSSNKKQIPNDNIITPNDIKPTISDTNLTFIHIKQSPKSTDSPRISNDLSMLHDAVNSYSLISTSISSHSNYSSAISESKQVNCNSNADSDTGGTSYPGEVTYSNSQIQLDSLLNQKRPPLLGMKKTLKRNQRRRRQRMKKAMLLAIENEKNATSEISLELNQNKKPPESKALPPVTKKKFCEPKVSNKDLSISMYSQNENVISAQTDSIIVKSSVTTITNKRSIRRRMRRKRKRLKNQQQQESDKSLIPSKTTIQSIICNRSPHRRKIPLPNIRQDNTPQIVGSIFQVKPYHVTPQSLLPTTFDDISLQWKNPPLLSPQYHHFPPQPILPEELQYSSSSSWNSEQNTSSQVLFHECPQSCALLSQSVPSVHLVSQPALPKSLMPQPNPPGPLMPQSALPETCLIPHLQVQPQQTQVYAKPVVHVPPLPLNESATQEHLSSSVTFSQTVTPSHLQPSNEVVDQSICETDSKIFTSQSLSYPRLTSSKSTSNEANNKSTTVVSYKSISHSNSTPPYSINKSATVSSSSKSQSHSTSIHCNSICQSTTTSPSSYKSDPHSTFVSDLAHSGLPSYSTYISPTATSTSGSITMLPDKLSAEATLSKISQMQNESNVIYANPILSHLIPDTSTGIYCSESQSTNTTDDNSYINSIASHLTPKSTAIEIQSRLTVKSWPKPSLSHYEEESETNEVSALCSSSVSNTKTNHVCTRDQVTVAMEKSCIIPKKASRTTISSSSKLIENINENDLKLLKILKEVVKNHQGSLDNKDKENKLIPSLIQAVSLVKQDLALSQEVNISKKESDSLNRITTTVNVATQINDHTENNMKHKSVQESKIKIPTPPPSPNISETYIDWKEHIKSNKDMISITNLDNEAESNDVWLKRFQSIFLTENPNHDEISVSYNMNDERKNQSNVCDPNESTELKEDLVSRLLKKIKSIQKTFSKEYVD